MLCYGSVKVIRLQRSGIDVMLGQVRFFVTIYHDMGMYVRLGGHWLGKVR